MSDDATELRCTSGLHARVVDGQWVEVACTSRRCGKKVDTVVRHVFDLKGNLLRTNVFREPTATKG